MDMKRWAELMKKANEPLVKVTKEEKLKNFDLGAYFDFLEYWINVLSEQKGKLSMPSDEDMEIFHRRSIELGMIRPKYDH